MDERGVAPVGPAAAAGSSGRDLPGTGLPAGSTLPVPTAARELAAATVEQLPEPLIVFRVVRDERGVAVDLRPELVNTAACQQRPGAGRTMGTLCSDTWPELVRNGIFRRCLEVADTGRPAQGTIEHTVDHMGRPCGAEFQASLVGPDVVVLVQRDATAMLRADHQLGVLRARLRRLEQELADVYARNGTGQPAAPASLQDALTGLPNRTALLDRAEHALIRSRRQADPDRSVAVIAVDVDGFRELNAALGRAAGDAALRTVAARLMASVRQEDTVARMGADDFVVLCDNIDAVGLAKLRARIVESVGQPLAWRQDGAARFAPIEVSVAMAMAAADDSVDTLLVRVGDQLDQARRSRRSAPATAVR